MTYPHDDRDDKRSNSHDSRDPRGEGPTAERDLLPQGEYRVRCIAHKWGETNKNKYEQIGIALQIIEGKYANKRLSYYGTFASDKAEEITISAMRALGFRGVDICDLSSMYEGEAVATVEHEEYEGKTRARVKWLNGADVIMKKEMTPQELNRFAQRMKAKLARTATPAPPPTGTSRSDERRSPPAPRYEQREWSRQQAGRDDRHDPRDHQHDARRGYGAPNGKSDDVPW